MTDELIGGEGIEPSGGDGSVIEGTESTPAPLEVDDNTLIKVKGSDKPIKYGEAFKGFQSQFTKASQKAADLERRLAEREDRLRQIDAAKAQTQQGTAQQGTEAALQALKQLPYVSGEQQAQIVVGVAQALKQRDDVIGQLVTKLQSLDRIVSNLNSTHVNTSFDGKINKWLKDGGYPAEYAELAKEIYLAYEGDDLDEEFPQIFANRVTQIQKLIESNRRSQVDAARKRPFIPGKGGGTGPSSPLKMKGSESPKKVADQVWEAFLGGESET